MSVDPSRNLKAIQGEWVLIGLAAVSLILLFTVGTEFNYGGESVLLQGLLRMSGGRSALAMPVEVPVVISSFSPYFYWIFFPFISLFKMTSVASIVLVGRCFQVLVLGFHVFIVHGLMRKHFREGYSPNAFRLVTSGLLILFLPNFMAIRPDLYSFLVELLGFAVFINSLDAKRPGLGRVAVTGVLCGLAATLKLNTLGVAIGVGVYLLLDSLWVLFAVYSGCFLVTVAGLFAMAHLVVGPAFLLNVIDSLNRTQSFAIRALSDVWIGKVLNGFFIHYLVVFILIVAGLRQLQVRGGKKARLLGLVLAASVLVATLCQGAPGSWYNYYFGFFLLALIPASAGLKELWVNRPRPGIGGYFLWALMFFAASACFVRALEDADLSFNRRPNFNFKAAREFIEVQFPGRSVYTNDSNAAVMMHDKILVDPWAERYLSFVVRYAGYIPQIKEEIHRTGFGVALISGSGCEGWHPDGIFSAELSALTHLERKIGKLCFFRPE